MKKWHKLIEWSAARLKERSTWLGILAVISAAGYTFDTALLEKIVAVGTALAGLILMITKDYKNDTSRRSRIRKKGGKTLQKSSGTSNGSGLPVEPATPPRDSWGQKL